MATEIVANKIILELNDNGTFKSGIMQYRIRTDGSLDPKFKTMSIDDGVASTEEDEDALNAILANAKTHIETGEGLT